MQNNETIPPEFLDQMAEALKVLGHGRRLQILEYLDLHGECQVGEIVEALQAQQGAISQHLNKMRQAGLLSARRSCREVYYKIASEHPVTILNCIRKKFQEKS